MSNLIGRCAVKHMVAVSMTLIAISLVPAAAAPPNIVIIYADDLGWGDLSCYGNTDRKTPNLDTMANEGARLTDFYVSTASCAPSRVALLTGRFPYRTGVPRNPAPDAGLDHGINADETTLAEMLKTRGYATKCIGKWHLGHLPEYYPTRHGFDQYFGILYSNDMRPVMLCRDDQAVEYPVVQSYLTRRYTDEATRFIRENQSQPFFLYLPHAMPHKPLAASEKFYTPKTRDDLYSDVVRELDWSVGQVLKTLRELGLDRSTLVLFASDNGPSYGGSTGGLRGMKGSNWEGGIRVPGIFWFPGTIPAGKLVHQPCGTVDVFPTVCQLVGFDSGKLHVDGLDLMPLLKGDMKKQDRAIYAWSGTTLAAIRQGKWKLHLVKPRARVRGKRGDGWIDPRGPDGVTLIAPPEQYHPWQYPSPVDTPETVPAAAGQLFDLENDRAEQRDVAREHPQVVRELNELAQIAIRDADQHKLDRVQRGQTRFYLGPGRISPDRPMSIQDALDLSRSRHDE